MIRQKTAWDARSTISRAAHILERTALALTGASCALFVAAHVGRADIELIGSAATVFATMIYGGIGFYLGIDLPRAPRGADAVELLSAVGTFLAAVAAVISVLGIVLDETAHPGTAIVIWSGWAVGATMQIAAGIIARRKLDNTES